MSNQGLRMHSTQQQRKIWRMDQWVRWSPQSCLAGLVALVEVIGKICLLRLFNILCKYNFFVLVLALVVQATIVIIYITYYWIYTVLFSITLACPLCNWSLFCITDLSIYNSKILWIIDTHKKHKLLILITYKLLFIVCLYHIMEAGVALVVPEI